MWELLFDISQVEEEKQAAIYIKKFVNASVKNYYESCNRDCRLSLDKLKRICDIIDEK